MMSEQLFLNKSTPLPTERLPTIDGLRGIAVMGIVLMNVAGFALPSGAYFNPLAQGVPSRADLIVWATNFVLVDGKMRALFSILFGASTLIVVTRATATGADATRVHLARMATLALFGLAHWVLVWPGDILLHYAVIGALALPFTRLEPRRQIALAGILLLGQAVVQAVLLAGNLQLRAAALGPHAPADLVAQWHSFSAGIGIGRPQDVAAEIAKLRGGWGALIVDHVRELGIGVPFGLIYNGLETLAYMLIGMAALASGFLSGAWPRRRYAQTAALCLGAGLPLSALLCGAAARSGYDTIATLAAATLGGVPLRPVLALGYAALLIRWLGEEGALQARVRAAGRTAFSNYLLTSLLMTLVFDGWGLGQFARLNRAHATLIVPLVWLAMLAWSAPWLARFRYGPLEWTWRSLARTQFQPMRRRKAIESA